MIYQTLVKYNLQRQIKDEQLREKVTPSFEFGCRRTLLTNDWYTTLQKSNVKLITNRIQEIHSQSIQTLDGDQHPVDIIVWSTGFQVRQFSIPVYGINDYSLNQQWSQTRQVIEFLF